MSQKPMSSNQDRPVRSKCINNSNLRFRKNHIDAKGKVMIPKKFVLCAEGRDESFKG